MKSRLTYLFVFFACFVGVAQNGITGNPDWQIKPVISKGFILVHRISIGHLVKGYPTNYELNISKPSLGNKPWHIENNKPDFGITLQCLDFANPSQLGYAFTVAPYIEIPFNEKVKATRMVMRVCWGATYITKHFDIQNNHKNIAMGSHINSFVQFRWFWQLALSQKLRFEPGITFTHASNGRARNPNLGLNVVSLSLGLNYLISSSKKPSIVSLDTLKNKVRRNEVTINAAYGFNERSIGSPELNSYLLSVAYQRNIRRTHKFSAGVDVFYDQDYQLDLQERLGRTGDGLEKIRVVTKVGYAYNIGRISIPIELGYYAYQKVKPDGYVVSRLGVRYYDPSGLIVSFGLRTHFAVAYTFEYGLGYKINFGT